LSHRKNLKSSGWKRGMGKNVFFPEVGVLVIKDNLPGRKKIFDWQIF
jgi:hypothetical protein